MFIGQFNPFRGCLDSRVGRRSHELRGHRDEFPSGEYNGQAADKSSAEEKIQMPRMHKHRNAFGGLKSHGGTVPVCGSFCPGLWLHAPEVC